MTTTATPISLAIDHERPAVSAWFQADWLDVTFMHFAIDPELLQPHVPFDLDLYDGKAWVSLVTFTQSDLRPAKGGALTSWITQPVARHTFLNLRTYVNAGGHKAIYFLAEWIPNRLSMLVGPPVYGLPFRLARMDYTSNACDVRAAGAFHVEPIAEADVERPPAALTEFLLERYTAFTCRKGRGRMFHIDHEPWPWRHTDVRIADDSLIRRAAPWFKHAQFVCAHESPGVRDVDIGGPIRVTTARPMPPAPSKLLTWAPGT